MGVSCPAPQITAQPVEKVGDWSPRVPGSGPKASISPDSGLHQPLDNASMMPMRLHRLAPSRARDQLARRTRYPFLTLLIKYYRNSSNNRRAPSLIQRGRGNGPMKLQRLPSRVAEQVLSPPVVKLEDGDMGAGRGSLELCVCAAVCPVLGTVHTTARSEGWRKT